MKFTHILLASLLLPLCASADVQTDDIYGPHMVLQQGKQVPISGTCTSKGSVEVSFAGQTVQAKVKGKKWKAVLEPMEANAEGQPLTVTQGSSTLTLDDVVVGEVWIASGQSNMLWRLNQTGDRAALNAKEDTNFRFFHSEPQVHTNPGAYTEDLQQKLKDGEMYEGSWAVDAASSRPRMSAVGYYFGKALQKQLGVPVGIIHASLGGSEMMAWMPPAVVKKSYRDCDGPRWVDSNYMSQWVRGRILQNTGNDPKAPHPYKPSYLFQTGITPWVDFPVAGVIWYQGESDAEIKDQKQNAKLLTDLIKGWRTEFKSPKMPFLMVQLPRIKDSTPLRAYWPEFREVQQRVAEALPSVYSLTTIDLGMTNSDVHPPRKVEVGTRLANLAAAKVYGKEVPFSGPAVTKAEPNGSKIVLTFEHADGLKTKDGQAPVGFEVSANGKDFKQADAAIEGDTVVLSSPDVKKPTAARYAWTVFIEPNLVNAQGLPAVPYCPPSKAFRKKKD